MYCRRLESGRSLHSLPVASPGTRFATPDAPRPGSGWAAGSCVEKQAISHTVRTKIGIRCQYMPEMNPVSRRRGDGLQARLPNRQVDQGGSRNECHIRVPHPLVAAGTLERDAAEVGAEESTNLVRQQGHPKERGEIAYAEELADDRRS